MKAEARSPALSIVMATYNRRDLLQRTLPSLLAQDYPAPNYEVVVVVDGSTDGTADYLRSVEADCNLEIIERPNSGPSAARNAGIAAAAGDYILLIDDDIRVVPELVREHMNAHVDAPDARVHGSIFVAPESPKLLPAWITHQWYVDYDAQLRTASPLTARSLLYLNANSSMPAEALREFGGFDEAVPFPREDFELALRIRRAGIPALYHPAARAYEVFTKTSRSFVWDADGYARAELVICRKFPDYQADSLLAPMDRDGPSPRALNRRVVPLLPRRTEELLAPAVSAAERLSRRPRARRAGIRLLDLQHRMVMLQSAADAAGSPAKLREQFDRRLAILLYHRVGDKTAGLHPALSISPDAFRRQIGWLAKRGFTAIRPSDWVDWRQGLAGLPEKPVLITFDDAYAEIAEHALPVLDAAGFPSVVFVVTGRLGGMNTWDSASEGGPGLMTADTIRHWARRKVEFGAHSRTHPDLSTLSETAISDEVLGSRDDLEALLDQHVTSFAYPFGLHNGNARRIVAANFATGFGIEEGTNGMTTPIHMLRRTGVSPRDTLLDVSWRATHGRMPLMQPRQQLRLRTRLERARHRRSP